MSLLRLAPVADALTVEEPVALLTYFGQGRSDIDDMVERLKGLGLGYPAAFRIKKRRLPA